MVGLGGEPGRRDAGADTAKEKGPPGRRCGGPWKCKCKFALLLLPWFYCWWYCYSVPRARREEGDEGGEVGVGNGDGPHG